MLQLLRIIVLLLFVSSNCFASINSVEEEDGSPSLFPWKLKVSNGSLTDNGDGTASLDTSGSGGFAPVGATYITQTANGSLTNEQALGALASGILKNTTTTGVLSIATAGTDYFSASSHVDHDATTNFVANEHIDWTSASAGTIHATNYVDNDTTTNETITLSGDASGSGTSSIAVTIANDAIEESMLKAVNVAVDEDIVTYEATTGDFEYHTPSELITAGDNISWTGSTLNVTAHTTDTNANTICTGTTTYLDGEGNCDDISSVYEPAGITESDISDLNHTATAITDGLIVEADLNEDSGTPTDEDVLTYDSTGANFNWVAQSTLAAGTAAALAANGANCSAGSYPLGVDASGAVESCTDATTEIDSAISTHAGNATAHQALVTLAGTPDYITITGQEITRGTIDIGDDTNLAGGTNITLSGDTLNVDDVFVLTAGDTMTGELVADDLGIEFTPGDTLTNCSSFSATGGGIFYDDSEGKFKKCQDNTLTDLDTTGSGISNVVEDTTPQLGGTLDGENNDINDVKNIVLNGTSVGTSADGVIALTVGTAPSTSPTDTAQLYAGDVTLEGSIIDQETSATGQVAEIYSNSTSTERGVGVDYNTSSAYSLKKVEFSLRRLGTPTGQLSARVYTVSSGLPNTELGESAKVDISTLSTTNSWVEFTFSSAISLSASTDYIIMCERPSTDDAYTGDGANHIKIYGTGGNTNSNNKLLRNNSDSYSSSGGDDVAFKAYEEGATTAELIVRDEAGNTTTLSPHNKVLIPKEKQEQVEQESDGLGWTYFSCNGDKCINVDMFSAIRLIEKLSGEKLIYSENANINPVESIDVLAEIENLKQVKQDKQQQP